jgi:hypothetical protein
MTPSVGWCSAPPPLQIKQSPGDSLPFRGGTPGGGIAFTMQSFFSKAYSTYQKISGDVDAT